MMSRTIYLVFSAVVGISLSPAALAAPAANPPATSATAPSQPQRIDYAPARVIATLANKRITESSGLACGRRNRNIFWTHNDSGDGPTIYAIGKRGEDLGTFTVSGAKARDWEDIASFTLDKKHYLLLADVGDNRRKRKKYTLYIVEEPLITGKKRPAAKAVKLVQTITFQYPRKSINCESVAVDTTERAIYLVGKDPTRTVYRLAIPAKATKKVLLARRVADLKIGWTTAMDISPDGLRAVVLTYGPAVQYVRKPSETWARAFSRRGRMIILPIRKQGESICYGPDGRTLYLTSEHRPTPLIEVTETTKLKAEN